MNIPLSLKIKLKLAKFLSHIVSTEISVRDKGYSTRFHCSNKVEMYRAISLWDKEPGTMKWIDEGVKPGDVFLDIGANIGIYSLAAAQRLSNEGRVYSIEPHKPSVVSLLRNVDLNNFGKIIEVFSIPLASNVRVDRFNYKDLTSAVTGSQFGSNKINANEHEFTPVCSEVCISFSIDELIKIGAMRCPSIIKIDVDGIELDILKGMSSLLVSEFKPRSIQVELNVGEHDKVINFMDQHGYTLSNRHLTARGQKKLDNGQRLDQIAHNAVFIPKPFNRDFSDQS